MSIDIPQTGILGVQRGMAGIQEAASNIASASNFNAPQTNETEPTPQKSLEESLIDLKENEHYTKASLEVLKAHDDMIGAILDVTG